jgi:energy-coupling factor transporter transmembrane protein EcfT
MFNNKFEKLLFTFLLTFVATLAIGMMTMIASLIITYFSWFGGVIFGVLVLTISVSIYRHIEE